MFLEAFRKELAGETKAKTLVSLWHQATATEKNRKVAKHGQRQSKDEREKEIRNNEKERKRKNKKNT